MPGDNRLIRTIQLTNLLSFGPDSPQIELLPLNVLIGPNASGKSNIIEAIDLLCSTPSDLSRSILDGGGISEWLWKGASAPEPATINATIHSKIGTMPLRHKLELAMVGQRFELVDEAIENEHPFPGHDEPFFYYRFQHGRPILNVRTSNGADTDQDRMRRQLRQEDLKPNQSVLAQRKDPDQYPEITYLIEKYTEAVIYREWHLGRSTAPRLPQQTDIPGDFLSENASNLVLVLNDLQHRSDVHQELLELLQRFNPYVNAISARIHGGTVQLFIGEEFLHQPIPATRLSDGTLRYLCLLAVLCHPTPPPLICIEEPELGLHPDIIPTIAELLVKASQRTQLIVTTHSDALVSALSHVPESILVTENTPDGTSCKRLSQDELSSWLEKYTLGELWRMGEIGGNQT